MVYEGHLLGFIACHWTLPCFPGHRIVILQMHISQVIISLPIIVKTIDNILAMSIVSVYRCIENL